VNIYISLKISILLKTAKQVYKSSTKTKIITASIIIVNKEVGCHSVNWK